MKEISFIIMVVIPATIGISLVARTECLAKWKESNIPVRWGFFSGCQVNPGAGYIPAENYRDITNEQ